MQELILSRMMRISRGTYYSGSWSSTDFISFASLLPLPDHNPSYPRVGPPPPQPPGLQDNGKLGVAWVIYRIII